MKEEGRQGRRVADRGMKETKEARNGKRKGEGMEGQKEERRDKQMEPRKEKANK